MINQTSLSFEDLASHQQAILKLIAISYDNARQTNVARQLNDLEITTESGAKFNGNNIKLELIDLGRMGWLSMDGTGAWEVPKDRRGLVMRHASRDPLFKNYVNTVTPPNKRWTGFWYYGSAAELRQELWIAYYGKEEKRYIELLSIAGNRFQLLWNQGYFDEMLEDDFDEEWINELPPSWQMVRVEREWVMVKSEARDPEALRSFLEEHTALTSKTNLPLRKILNDIYLLQGDLPAVDQFIERESVSWAAATRKAGLAALRGRDTEAIAGFQEALKLVRKETGRRGEVIDGINAMLYLLALLRRAEGQFTVTIEKYLVALEEWEEDGMGGAIFIAVKHLQNHTQPKSDALETMRRMEKTMLDWVGLGWALYWTEQQPTRHELKKLEEVAALLHERGYHWPALELYNTLAHLVTEAGDQQNWRKQYQSLRADTGIESFLTVVPRLATWERALDALIRLDGGSKRAKKKEVQKRLIWLVDFQHHQIEPRIQQLNKNGQWTSGRKVALKRLKQEGVDGMESQDLGVLGAIQEQSYYTGWYGSQGTSWEINFNKAIDALAGHPRVFLMNNPSVAIELTRQAPQLLVEEEKDDLVLRFNHDFTQPGVYIIKETPTRYIVLDVTQEHASIRQQIGTALHVPMRARRRLTEVMSHLGNFVPIQSTLTGDVADMPTVEGDPTTVVHLLPLGDAFKLEFFVKPFRTHPPYFKPGAGRERVVAEIDGQSRMAVRRLDRELTHAQTNVSACPTLQRLGNQQFEWLLDTPEDCLNVLLELQPLRAQQQILLEHPKGEPLRLLGQVDYDDLSLRVKGERDWFSVNGSLRIGEREVLDFKELLAKAADAKSRFIELSDGQFLALTERLRRKLSELNAVLTERGKDLRLHPLAGELIDEFSGELASFKEDKIWRETRDRLRDARRVRPKVPSTFRAELRPYQEDGYRWLMQLSAWGVGACLADDMGLGKTIQALAVLTARAEEGPALVVAPASVTRNWLRETQRFAPTLRPQLLGPGDRAEMIDALGPYDLLLVSYGLLPYEQEKLAAKKFGTIILDEAQAIKNRATKRSQAAKELQADFRMITTGTPIENHLGELWNLFHFLNPGLLGSLEQFNQRFAGPIERDNDAERRAQLRKLVHPFILRRRKEDVLLELPEKTDINLSVELSAAERAFYEALRRQALEEIEAADGPQKRMRILAELTKLRQAACHPRMVQPDISIGSAKLDLVAETIEELRENGHKALIFSQFVKHLRLVENWVKEKGIPYQYLDGQTPGPKREEAVQAFQRGEGDLFLISLKAGGTGLNLTAADYVLHLDPWWNPAVEDQASDRAHRIGQQRPVTVYRFIAEDTIEEKIVQLHHDKRDLADSLLSGAERSASLSVDELVALIREG